MARATFSPLNFSCSKSAACSSQQVLMVEEPELPGACEGFVPLGKELPVFLPAHRVHCFVEMFGDRELVMHQCGLRHRRPTGGNECRCHVQRHRFDAAALFLRETLPEGFRRRLIAALHDLQYPALIQIGQKRNVRLPGSKTLFINPHMGVVLPIPVASSRAPLPDP